MTIELNRSPAFLLCVSLLFSAAPYTAAAKTEKPTLAQIEAAKQYELEKKRKAALTSGALLKAKNSLTDLIELTDAARARQSKAQIELNIATRDANLAAAKAKLASNAVLATHREIGKLAMNAFIMGGGLTDIESVLNANGPQEIIDILSSLQNLGSAHKTVLNRLSKAERIARSARREAESTQQLQLKATKKLSIAKQGAEVAQALQQNEVDKLEKIQDQLLRELASAKRVRVTLQQRRQLALLEEARAIQAAKTKGQAKLWKSDGTNGRLTSRTSQEQRNRAVEFAKKQVLANKPYVWGSEGPNSFDCSGLVYAAFKYAGLGWPNWDRLNASLYYSYTKHVSLSEIQPGDLLFYSYDGSMRSIHHMSIYAGNGMAWEARSTKTGLRYSSIYSVEGMMPFAGRV